MRLRLLTLSLCCFGLALDAEAAEVSVFPTAAKGRGKRAPRKQAKSFQTTLVAALTEAGHTTKLVGSKKLMKRASRCRGKRVKACLQKVAAKVGDHVLVSHVSKVKRKVYVSVHVVSNGKHVGVAGGKLGSGVAAKAVALLPKVAAPEPEPEPEPAEEAAPEKAPAETTEAAETAPATPPDPSAATTAGETKAAEGAPSAEAAPAAEAAAPAAAPSVATPAGKSKMVPYVLIGVGAAIAGGGYATFGTKAASLHDELSAGIERGPVYDEKSEEFLHNRLMADVIGGTGIAVAAYGVYRLVSD